MSDKVLVVTGGSRGIGAATCRLGAERGYAVVVNYAGNVEAAEAVCADIHAKGGKAVAVRGDVSVPEDVEHIFRAADRLGTLTALCNNAGIIDLKARVDEMTPERLARMFAVNVTGSFMCARQAILRMSTRHGGKGGSIVNLTSAASKLGAPAYYVDYASSKGAIDTFTIGLALELAEEGIRVNSVRPGIIETDIHAAGGDPDRAQKMVSSIPMKRTGSSEEVAQSILWLMSDEAAYVTGATIPVTGGRGIAP
jgi:NAD(P)-dependent dehydrogenase (short-subunit alcohol dehydrogenase family)